MPKVGKKEYPYTKAGIQAAKNEASMTGQDMQVSDARSRSNVSMGYRGGGSIGQMTKPPITPGTEGKKGSKDPFDTSGKEYEHGGKVMGDFSEGRWNDLLPDIASPSTPAAYGQPRPPLQPPVPTPYDKDWMGRVRPPVDDDMMYEEGGKIKDKDKEVEEYPFQGLVPLPKGGVKKKKVGGKLRPHKGDKDPKTGVTYKKGGKTKPSFKVTGGDDYAEKMAKHIGEGGAFGNKKGGKLEKKGTKGKLGDWLMGKIDA
tara:strand:- start:1280 stop:2050 length:771 start_codon:yes stop_codon:yes gene_type:complete